MSLSLTRAGLEQGLITVCKHALTYMIIVPSSTRSCNLLPMLPMLPLLPLLESSLLRPDKVQNLPMTQLFRLPGDHCDSRDSLTREKRIGEGFE